MQGGDTKFEHLKRIEKQTGIQQIPEYEIPPEGEHLWDWFWDLSKRRPQGFGVSLIPYSEIQSWLSIRKPLTYDWEIDIIMKMDLAFMETHIEVRNSKKEDKTKTK